MYIQFNMLPGLRNVILVKVKSKTSGSDVTDIVLYISFLFLSHISFFSETFGDIIWIIAVLPLKTASDLLKIVACFIIKTMVPM